MLSLLLSLIPAGVVYLLAALAISSAEARDVIRAREATILSGRERP